MSGRVARPREALRTALRRRSISEISCAAADVEAALPAGSVLPAVTVLALNAAPPPPPAGAGPSGECSTGYGGSAPGELDEPSEAGELRFALSDPYEGERLRRRCASSPPAPCVAPTASRPTSRDDGSWALGERAYGDRRGGSTGMRGGGVPGHQRKPVARSRLSSHPERKTDREMECTISESDVRVAFQKAITEGFFLHTAGNLGIFTKHDVYSKHKR